MNKERRIICGLECFLCKVTNCWMTERGCAINRAVASRVLLYIEAGIPVWAIAVHLMERTRECTKCAKYHTLHPSLGEGKPGADAVDKAVRKEVDELYKQIEEMLETEEYKDNYDMAVKARQRKWWQKHKDKQNEKRRKDK